jgi:hypothetical protein
MQRGRAAPRQLRANKQIDKIDTFGKFKFPSSTCYMLRMGQFNNRQGFCIHCLVLFLLALAAGLQIQTTDDATTSTTGSITAVGGLGVQKGANIGGTLNVAGAATFAGNLQCGGTFTHGVIVRTATNQAASFATALAAYGTSGNYAASTHHRSDAITITGAAVGDPCSVSPHITFTSRRLVEAEEDNAEVEDKQETATGRRRLTCTDNPSDWVSSSSSGSTCTDYVNNNYCTSSGGFGTGWQSSYGVFDDYATDGIDASEACCGCGGGSTGSPTATPTSTPTAGTSDAITTGSGAGNCKMYCYVGAANTVYVVLAIGALDIIVGDGTAFTADATLANSLPVNIAVYGVSS